MGAITYTEKFKTVFGNKRISVGTITFSNSYASNGDTIDFVALMGIKAEAAFLNPSVGGYSITMNAALTKIIAYETGSGKKRVESFFDSEEIQETHFVPGTMTAIEIFNWIPQFDGEISAFDIEYGSIGVAGRTIIDLEIDGITALDDELESTPALSIDASGNTITFDAAAETITRASGSWVTDGFAIGDTLQISGSTSNNGLGVLTISNLTATVMTITEDVLVNETNTTLTIVWTPESPQIDLVRAGAIASGAKQFTNGQEITIDVDQIAAGTAGTDLSATISVKRYIGVKASIKEFTAPVTGTISAVTLEVGVCGSGGGGTTIDVNVNGTSCFTTEPVVAHDAADGSQDTGTIDLANDDVTVGDTISIDIDAVPTNKDAEQISVQIEFTPTADALGEVPNASDLSSETALIMVIGE